MHYVTTQFNSKIKAIQSDFGGEFRPFTKFLNELSVIHKLTCPHTSHQNGTVERKHRQIVEMGLTLLAQASLPLDLWDHSFTTYVYLINCLPTSAHSNFSSPYLALYHKQPDYLNLKIFGCSCYPHLRPYNQHKLDFKSLKCVYLGISSTHKGHKCMNKDGRIFISKNSNFNEEEFPYMIFQTQTTTSTTKSHKSSLTCPRHLSHIPCLRTSSPEQSFTLHNLEPSVLPEATNIALSPHTNSAPPQ